MLTLRRATIEDAKAIYEVDAACFSTPWSLESITAELEEAKENERLYILADLDGKIIGYAGAWLVLDEGQITNIAVLPEYRREGYGAMMTRKLIRQLFEKGMNEIFLEVRLSNLGALALYRRLGFTVKGVRKNYYSDPQEDAYIMSRIKEEGI
ncbi:ribosomal protein S18-alanine N-acetyltransferase [uncultured Veillonella sp.]|uniref:ribosomal protein S18-alanine N-acetyltransferase n=1 Tax=uncultured Veillonella sp. TaxID=159268 RepID=UPI002601C944|nr:ribosomal protein S18-alanine N-acetyltransferase [uncultured Veillonella sp.]